MKKINKFLCLFVALASMISLVACSSEDAESQTSTSTGSEEGEIEVEMVGNSFAVQFCNINVDGARAAAEELGNVSLNYNAPQDSSMLQEQIDMFNQAIAQEPDVILLSSADPDAMEAQMIKARDEEIPVIAYDIPFTNAPEGSLLATVATNNHAAAGLAAEEMLKNKEFIEKVKAATAENPVVVSVISPDAVMTAHKQRIEGFSNTLYELLQEHKPGEVEISGHTSFEKAAEGEASVIIRTDIAPTKADSDIRNLAQTVVSDEKVIGLFTVNEACVSAVLSATTDGADLDRENGKYKDILAVGFDAGKTLKNAVANQYFYGAVAQDPFEMGYQAVQLAAKVANGESVEDVDAPAIWYNHENMKDPEIEKILYD